MLTIQDFTPDETRHLHALGYNRGPRQNDLVEAWNYILEADKFDRRARDFERNECTRSAAAPARATAEEYNQRAIAALEHYRSHKGGNQMSATPTNAQSIGNTQQAAQQTSAALVEVRALRTALDVTQASLAEAIRNLGAKITTLTTMVEALASAPLPAQAAPAAQPDAHGNGYVTFLAETIVMTYNDAGDARYKVKGGRYAKFGVNLWPEALTALGVKAADLKPGPNAFGKMVRAELGETTNAETGEKSMVARKVVGLAE